MNPAVQGWQALRIQTCDTAQSGNESTTGFPHSRPLTRILHEPGAPRGMMFRRRRPNTLFNLEESA